MLENIASLHLCSYVLPSHARRDVDVDVVELPPSPVPTHWGDPTRGLHQLLTMMSPSSYQPALTSANVHRALKKKRILEKKLIVRHRFKTHNTSGYQTKIAQSGFSNLSLFEIGFDRFFDSRTLLKWRSGSAAARKSFVSYTVYFVYWKFCQLALHSCHSSFYDYRF